MIIRLSGEIMYYMTKILALFYFSLFGLVCVSEAAEPGYEEAMQYFVFRENNKDLIAQGTETLKVNNGNLGHGESTFNAAEAKKPVKLKPQKYFLGVGFGEASELSSNSFQIGASFVKTRFFQQSLYFEFNKTDLSASREYKDAIGEVDSDTKTYMFFQNLQFSSALFFLGPEVALGAGYRSGGFNEGGLVSLKAGLNFSNRWSKQYMISASILYRNDQMITDNISDNSIELLVRFGI